MIDQRLVGKGGIFDIFGDIKINILEKYLIIG